MILVTTLLLLCSILGDLAEESIRLIFYADLTLVGVAVQFISLKRPSILDHGPTLIILFRGAIIILMHFAKLN